jgi:hypothetical protein
MSKNYAVVNVQVSQLPMCILPSRKRASYEINNVPQSTIENNIKHSFYKELCAIDIGDILTQKLKGEIDTNTISAQFALAVSFNFDKFVKGVELTNYDLIFNDEDYLLLSVYATVVLGSFSCKVIGEITEDTAKALNGVIENYKIDSMISKYISIDDINVEITDIEN